MPDFTENNRIRWRKFVRKNLLLYFVPNVLLNTVIPYFVLSAQPYVYLFNGEQNLARFLLPMSLLLPFLITIDVLKKVRALKNDDAFHFVMNKEFEEKRKMFKLAGLHSFYTILIVSITLFIIHISFPAHFDFGVTASVASSGILAGFYSIAFFFLSIRKIRVVN
ncbi:hypothetical protein [Pedobacter sp. N23S346]|uniref:hypothetical protein n=1 Tax=Pedobacter sp. N23S346 TaxID=3402750 RepID=UPI003AD162EB